MAVLLSLVALALVRTASAIDIGLYVDQQCTIGQGAVFDVFNGVCTGAGGYGSESYTFTASCQGTGSAQVTIYNTTASSNAPPRCAGTTLFSGAISSTCTQLWATGNSVLPFVYGKISGNKPCAAPGPAFFVSMYNAATCGSGPGGYFSVVADGQCSNSTIFQGSEIKPSSSGQTLSLPVWDPARNCQGPADFTLTMPSGSCVNLQGAPVSYQAWASTSGAFGLQLGAVGLLSVVLAAMMLM